MLLVVIMKVQLKLCFRVKYYLIMMHGAVCDTYFIAIISKLEVYHFISEHWYLLTCTNYNCWTWTNVALSNAFDVSQEQNASREVTRGIYIVCFSLWNKYTKCKWVVIWIRLWFFQWLKPFRSFTFLPLQGIAVQATKIRLVEMHKAYLCLPTQF